MQPLPSDPASRLVELARLDRVVDMATWGLFFVWVGLYWFTELSWNWCLVGIGVIFLTEAAFRSLRQLKVSGMAVFFGMLFLGGGLWGMAQAPQLLVPGLFVIFGVAMVVRAIASAVRQRG